MLSFSTRTLGPDITVIELSGRLTLGRDSGQIETGLLKLLDEGVRKFVIDVAKVEYMDSTGIGKIAYCYGKITQAGGQARVAGARGLVMDLFRITRMDRVIRFFPDVETASADLAGDGQSQSTAS
jgi:anti-sigma B factor antagonist